MIDFLCLRFSRNMKIIHYIGGFKPWKCRDFIPSADTVPGSYHSDTATGDFIRRWWLVFNRSQEVFSAFFV